MDENRPNGSMLIFMIFIFMIIILVFVFVLGYRIGFAEAIAYIKPYMTTSLPIPI